MSTVKYDNMEELLELSEEERKVALEILQEYSKEGKSETYSKMMLSDFKEIPVDIITFVKDPKYLGKAFHLSNGKCKLFPYWEEVLKDIFPDNMTTKYNNAIFSGARGLGKSEIAVVCGLYIMYRLMCLKNPHQYLNLKPTEKVAFAFMNITEYLAYDIGVSKFQNTVQMSPWFMERGTITGKSTLIWNPPDFIDIIVGSQPRHVIGQPILFCLDGDTIIKTVDGDFKIKDLKNKKTRVYSLDSNNNIVISDECYIKQTAVSNEEIEIELEDGSILKCTPSHKLMLKDGSYKEAQYLTEKDELMDIKI